MKDVVAVSRTVRERIELLKVIFDIIENHELWSKIAKYKFAKVEFILLGHTAGADRTHVSPKNTAMKNGPILEDATSPRSTLGLARYFRSFVEHFSQTSAELFSENSRNT